MLKTWNHGHQVRTRMGNKLDFSYVLFVLCFFYLTSSLFTFAKSSGTRHLQVSELIRIYRSYCRQHAAPTRFHCGKINDQLNRKGTWLELRDERQHVSESYISFVNFELLTFLFSP